MGFLYFLHFIYFLHFFSFYLFKNLKSLFHHLIYILDLNSTKINLIIIFKILHFPLIISNNRYFIYNFL